MNQLKYSYKLATIFIALVVLACAIPGLGDNSTSQPAVAISSPSAEQKLEVGRETTVESVSVDAEGISRVELAINGETVWVDANANPEPDIPFIVAQPWTPEVPGTYIIQVNAYNTDNVAGESKPLTVEAVAVSAATVGEASPTPGETDVPVILSTQATDFVPTPAETPTGTNSPPDTPTRPSVTPTDTPRSQAFASTGFEPEGRFNEIWLELGAGNSRLGYPIGPEIVDRNYARQHFENGLMFWWDNPEDPDDIWVMDTQPQLLPVALPRIATPIPGWGVMSTLARSHVMGVRCEALASFGVTGPNCNVAWGTPAGRNSVPVVVLLMLTSNFSREG